MQNYLHYLKLYFPDYSILNLVEWNATQDEINKKINGMKNKKEMIVFTLPKTNKLFKEKSGIVILGSKGIRQCFDLIFDENVIDEII